MLNGHICLDTTTLPNKNIASNSYLHFVDNRKENLSSPRHLPMLIIKKYDDRVYSVQIEIKKDMKPIM